MQKPSYQTLENNYPDTNKPCDQTDRNGDVVWKNQCAIRVSIALIGAGCPLDGYSEPTCKHGHARGAESLATYLWRNLSKPKIYRSGDTAKAELASKQGIIFFKDIAGFRGGIGDHIDLWDGTKTMTGEYFSSMQQVWFWKL
jgi:hypothetical protein